MSACMCSKDNFMINLGVGVCVCTRARVRESVCVCVEGGGGIQEREQAASYYKRISTEVFIYHYSLLPQAWHALPPTGHSSFQ